MEKKRPRDGPPGDEHREEGPHLRPNGGTAEFSLRDPDGCFVSISARGPDRPWARGMRGGVRVERAQEGGVTRVPEERAVALTATEQDR